VSERTISVGIVDDHDLFREGIAALLRREGRISIAGQAADSDGAVALVRDFSPDVLLLDVSLPGDPARTTILRSLRLDPKLRIVILTMHQDALLRSELLAAGARAYLTKTAPSAELVSTILRVATERSVAWSVDEDAEPSENSRILSAREHEVLRLIAQAYSNREISDELHVAEGTVKRHTTNIYAKLGASSRIDAVRKATRLGILTAQTALP
jgi:DNA-binding NarL/FixJ family response regulator